MYILINILYQDLLIEILLLNQMQKEVKLVRMMETIEQIDKYLHQLIYLDHLHDKKNESNKLILSFKMFFMTSSS
jgi:hypothetical protein